MEVISGIYKITNIATNDFYIGSSKDINKRFNQHTKALIKNKHGNKYLQSSWNKYGSNYFILEILEIVDINILIETEQKYLNDLNPTYNISRIASGGSGPGWHHTEEAKQRISRNSSGVAKSELARRNMSNGAKKRYENPDERNKSSLLHKNKMVSEETKQKIKQSKTGMKYGPHSEEHKRKLSESVRATKAKRKLERVNERLS